MTSSGWLFGWYSRLALPFSDGMREVIVGGGGRFHGLDCNIYIFVLLCYLIGRLSVLI